eukprot:Nk52_evm53s158 gene=Nk52_evmTU53s158
MEAAWPEDLPPFNDSNSRGSFAGNVRHTKPRNRLTIHNAFSFLNPPKHLVSQTKNQDKRPGGFCAGITTVIGLHLLFNYGGQNATLFAKGYSNMLSKVYNKGYLFHLWEIQADAVLLVQSIANVITKNNLPDLLEVDGQGNGNEAFLDELPDLFVRYSTETYDKILSARQIALDIKEIFTTISPDYPFAFIPVTYKFYKVNLREYQIEHLTRPVDCEKKSNSHSVCSDGSHQTALIVTPRFIIYHDSNRFSHELWEFDPEENMKNVYSSIGSILQRGAWYHNAGTDQHKDVQKCLQKNYDTMRTCIEYLKNTLKRTSKVTFKVGSFNIESMKTKLQNQAKFNKYLKQKYRGQLTAEVLKQVTADHLIDNVRPHLQSFIEVLTFVGTRDTERFMWLARKQLKPPVTPQVSKVVGTLYCLATERLNKIHMAEEEQGLLLFEKAVQIFDFLMMLFYLHSQKGISRRGAGQLCKDYKKNRESYSANEKDLIEKVCLSNGSLRKFFKSTNNFLTRSSSPLKSLAHTQVNAELQGYFKCITDNVKDTFNNIEDFTTFLKSKVIPVIYDYGYSAYLLVKKNLGNSPTVDPTPIPYDSQISNWAIENTGELMTSDSIKAFLGQSLFFTYAVPRLLTFLPTDQSNLIARHNLKENLFCAGNHLLKYVNMPVGACFNIRNSGLRIDWSYLNRYLNDNGNLFTFLDYMLGYCDYSSEPDQTAVEERTGMLLRRLETIGFPHDEVKEYVTLFVKSFEYYKNSAIFSKNTPCGRVISKINDGHQYLYAFVRLISLHENFQRKVFSCETGEDPRRLIPPFLQKDQFCYFPGPRSHHSTVVA